MVSFKFKTLSRAIPYFILISSSFHSLPHRQPAFELPEEQVVVLGHVQNLKAGDVVMAVYPETTAFYSTFVSVFSISRRRFFLYDVLRLDLTQSLFVVLLHNEQTHICLIGHP